MVRRRPARARASRRGLVGLLIAAITWIGAVAVTASAVAAIGTPVDVVGGGITMSSGFGSPGTSFDIDATDDGTGPSGTFRVMAPFGPNWTGVVTCLSVTGNTAIVGGTSSNPGSIPPEVAVTFMVVDNGPTNDTIVINGPGNIDPPCTPSPFGIAQSLQSGGLTVATGGAAAAGHASGNGTQSLGFGSTTTFAFDADRSARGVVSGTFTFTEGFSSPQTGSVTCLVVTGSTAVIGVLTNGSFGGPFPQPPRHDVWLVSDGGPGGEDTFASDAWSEFGSPDCADPPAAGPAITTGDIVVGAGAVPTPSPTLPPTEGSFGWMSANSQSQPLGGTAFTLSGPGVNLIVTDNGPNDSRPEVGLFAVDHLSIGQTYQVCETTIPADYYATSACQSRTLDGVNGGGFTFFHTFVVALTIDPLGTPPASVERLGRFEARFQLSRFYNLQVFDPAVIDINATFAAPSGRQTTVSAFWMNDYTVRAGTGIGVSEIYDVVPLSPPRPGFWAVRFSPDEVGTYSWSIRAADHQQPGAATVTGPSSTFTVTASSRHGQVGIDPRDSRFPALRGRHAVRPARPERRVRGRNPERGRDALLRLAVRLVRGRRRELEPRLDDRLQPVRPRVVLQSFLGVLHGRRPVRAAVGMADGPDPGPRGPAWAGDPARAQRPRPVQHVGERALGHEPLQRARRPARARAARARARARARGRRTRRPGGNTTRLLHQPVREADVQAAPPLPGRPLRRLPQPPGLGAVQRGPEHRPDPGSRLQRADRPRSTLRSQPSLQSRFAKPAIACSGSATATPSAT